MTSITDGAVKIQTTSESNFSTPAWFGEVVLLTAHLRKHGVFNEITEQVRFARRRFGHYDVIDFLAVLFGYVISGERTLEEFYESLQPFAIPFMALFERDQLPSRSALSRFLAALTEAPVEALCMLFLNDLLGRPLTPDKQTGGLVDRAGNTWMVFDIDGTREAAPLREQCQWNGSTTVKPRQVSVLLHPLVVGPEPVFWHDWSRRHHRLMCMQLLRHHA